MTIAKLVEGVGHRTRLPLPELLVATSQGSDGFLEVAIRANSHHVAEDLDRHQDTFAGGVFNLDTATVVVNGLTLFCSQT
jgi:hypothetical protein